MTPSQRLAELGITLPDVAAPVGSYVPAIVINDKVMTSGQIPIIGGRLQHSGKVGASVTLEQAQDAAKTCVLNGVAAIAAALGCVDNITGILRLGVFVAGTPEFTDQPKVANAASDLLVAIFGDDGKHVRAAVGVLSLPLDAPVELEIIATVRQ